MNFIITKLESSTKEYIIWRLTPSGNFFKTLVILKQQDLKDIIRQIIDEDPYIVNYLKLVLKEKE